MIVLDASVLIAHLDDRDAHHAKARRLLADATAALERLRVLELPLGLHAPARLAQLRADTGRKLPDYAVLLAAQEHEGVVASFDAALIDAAAGLELVTLG